mgnify:CR=1 FL=1
MPKLQINDIDLYYETHGQGQPLVFIHGLGSSSADWERQTPDFSSKYKVVKSDLGVHGKSQKPPGPYSMSLFESDTAELIKSLELGPAHIVGISLGGMVAFQMAVDYPENEIPQEYQLAQNYPNPFNTSTTIEYYLPEQADVNVTTYDASGNELEVLFS